MLPCVIKGILINRLKHREIVCVYTHHYVVPSLAASAMKSRRVRKFQLLTTVNCFSVNAASVMRRARPQGSARGAAAMAERGPHSRSEANLTPGIYTSAGSPVFKSIWTEGR